MDTAHLCILSFPVYRKALIDDAKSMCSCGCGPASCKMQSFLSLSTAGLCRETPQATRFVREMYRLMRNGLFSSDSKQSMTPHLKEVDWPGPNVILASLSVAIYVPKSSEIRSEGGYQFPLPSILKVFHFCGNQDQQVALGCPLQLVKVKNYKAI